ncbi:conserved Plasmodium protein, unknown function [Plasmodium chabaudi chabaudi]|uniref:Uncharacterized protein n=2 Tax=Plasmodium chabaudi TaxID=5825 RepID=A0A077TQD9_PLACU|nr:conserved Plasmodium protein, unknown function [Plasmodium chabaudi chabaudi]SCM13471.1 conserved Plasmodium protein, unknown function [Plasmodium chabaudi adami]SCM24385.1 conserved Plasmodium protein, unknown function [Plasmodium chabaudi adami]SCM25864.1 conserved Plasmodium protein, unknown function [Plasmodium chabaudi chabaudi]SCN62619.1 conserved Plasmodium protein, unknown function [Plasmodium chabaudi chabaudi]VTZ70741.1 conserved Plasmodium protein, unknown function [Plasmodium ch|eukprot:XP_737236.2 conserved Plasmodium protein, unknown function [Plasmodium chabaudi chabaudi]
MYPPFFSLVKNNLNFSKISINIKNKNLSNFLKFKINENIIDDKINVKPQVKLNRIKQSCAPLNCLVTNISTNKNKPAQVYNLFNSYIYIPDNKYNNDICKVDTSRKVLYFKWKARKSYKKRVLNLPSTKSRRRYAQKNR